MGKRRNRVAPSKHTGYRIWLVGALIGIVGIVFVVAWHGQSRAPVGTPEAPTVSSGPSSAPAVPALARRETRPTLDPALFVGKAALAHQVAREIPDVLDHLYCYCYCDKHLGHKSLLSCYTDGHAAT
jgi:hypothetical protein